MVLVATTAERKGAWVVLLVVYQVYQVNRVNRVNHLNFVMPDHRSQRMFVERYYWVVLFLELEMYLH